MLHVGGDAGAGWFAELYVLHSALEGSMISVLSWRSG
jgi:hypothetical protein